jgi:hypothetical protein
MVFKPASKLAGFMTEFPNGPKLPEALPPTLALPQQGPTNAEPGRSGHPVLR